MLFEVSQECCLPNLSGALIKLPISRDHIQQAAFAGTVWPHYANTLTRGKVIPKVVNDGSWAC